MPSLSILRGFALTAALTLSAGIAATPGYVLAQDSNATPAAGGMQEEAHPAHIHSGTCDQLGDVVFPLNDVSPADMMTMGTPMAGGDMSQSQSAATPSAADSGSAASTPMAGNDQMQSTEKGEVVATSSTVVPAPLSDILAAPHAINVHKSMEEIDVYIACGEITGDSTASELAIDLNELNDSGYSGRARLMDNGDGTTTVDVMLMESETYSAGMEATPSS